MKALMDIKSNLKDPEQKVFWQIWYNFLPLMRRNSSFSSEGGKPQIAQTGFSQRMRLCCTLIFFFPMGNIDYLTYLSAVGVFIVQFQSLSGS